MFFRGRINWLIIAMCSLKAILIGAKELNSGGTRGKWFK